VPGRPRKLRPVRPKLEFHRDAGHNPEQKIDCKYPSPESSRIVITLIMAPDRNRLEDYQQKGQPHSQLGKDIVKCGVKAEVNSM
jgi:hypothetical protein